MCVGYWRKVTRKGHYEDEELEEWIILRWF
jgi:hypothetical protein